MNKCCTRIVFYSYSFYCFQGSIGCFPWRDWLWLQWLVWDLTHFIQVHCYTVEVLLTVTGLLRTLCPGRRGLIQTRNTPSPRDEPYMLTSIDRRRGGLNRTFKFNSRTSHLPPPPRTHTFHLHASRTSMPCRRPFFRFKDFLTKRNNLRYYIRRQTHPEPI